MTDTNKQLIAALESALAALKKKEHAEDTGMPWFYPSQDDEGFVIRADFNGFGYEILNQSGNNLWGDYPAIRTKEQAKRIAWARGEADRWRAMGMVPDDCDYLYFINWEGYIVGIADFYFQIMHDALFPTEKAAEEALEKFGGFEHLQKVRRGLWGLE